MILLDQKGFNKWARTYNESVKVSNSKDTYPFAGYEMMMEYIRYYTEEAVNALDLGVGTGYLWEGQNVYVTGIDFSSEMLDIARTRIDEGVFIEHDLKAGLPSGLGEYDVIVSTYAIHHFEDDYKIKLINDCMKHLKKDGVLLIGDVSFETRDKLIECKEECGRDWDDSEFYFVAKEIMPLIPHQTTYIKVSYCAGLLAITPLK